MASVCNAFFAQLEDLPREAQGEYCALKSIELLFLLCNHSLHPLEFHGRRYWDQDQMEAIRQTHDYILTHLSQPLTIDSLARRFHISGTFLKEGFRQMYGQSTRKFLQAKRMDLASDLLRRTDQSVLQIAAALASSPRSLNVTTNCPQPSIGGNGPNEMSETKKMCRNPHVFYPVKQYNTCIHQK